MTISRLNRSCEMRGYVLISVLMAMFFSTAVFSQEPGEVEGRPEENLERRMHLRRMQLELEEHEAELDFHRRMQELELEERSIALEHKRKSQEHPKHFKHCNKKGKGVFVIILLVVNILLAVWVYGDIRKRNCGSGIWIVIVLLTGLFGVLPYAIVRLGDIRQTK